MNKQINFPGHLDIFWLNFNKENHSFLHSFRLGGKRFPKSSTWSFDWEIEAWVKVHRFNAFSRNVNTRHGGTYKFKKIQRAFWREIKPWGFLRNMKGCLIEADIGGQGQGWLPISWFYPGGWDILKRRERLNKGVLKKRIEASLYTLYWYFKIIPFTLYTYVLAKILQNGAKFIQKTDS